MTQITTEDRFIQARHGQLFVRHWRVPTAPITRAPVVLLHDSLGCVELWREFPAQLAQAMGREVIAYDRLGFGRSDPHPGTLSPSFIEDEARQDFASLRQALGLQQFIVFGHSVGGGMAVGCAAHHADACQGLITESAQAFLEDRTVEGILIAQQLFAQPGQVERLQRYHADKARWVLDAWIETWLSPAFVDWNLDASLHRVTSPALVLHGDRDDYGSHAHPQRIAGLLGDKATLALLDDCGHVPHREMPETVLEYVERWNDALIR